MFNNIINEKIELSKIYEKYIKILCKDNLKDL